MQEKLERKSARKRIILCVDDYALHPFVDQAVLELAQRRRVSATSCMTSSPHWPTAAKALLFLSEKDQEKRLFLGLHLNFTESHDGAVEAFGLREIIVKTYFEVVKGKPKKNYWQAQVCQQLDAFETYLDGRQPDFIDGHQHVHQLPGIREALLSELQQRPNFRPWLRSTLPPTLFGASLKNSFKALTIAALGGWSAKRLWQDFYPMNPSFGGVYGFDAFSPEAYRQHMREWLRQAEEGSLLMCHPAVDVVPNDAIGRQRVAEFAYLSSPEFIDDLQENNCELT